ncbi:MAG: NnrS family protein [Rhodospirillaceae bacterium]|nr:NnrS family protein [Rhodospirillaceae bacterium]
MPLYEKRAMPTLLQNGFRPFFLMAGLYGSLLVPLWLGAHLNDWVRLPWPAGLFHGHELIFGFVAAVISGFLLTAVPNWEGTTPASGLRLLLLVIIWIGGRAVMWSAGYIPPFVVFIIDVSYLPLLIIIGIPELLKSSSSRNKVFVALIALLSIANILTHITAGDYNIDVNPLTLAINLVAILIAILGGRVVPGFTSGALGPSAAMRQHSRIDTIAIGSIVVLAIADLASGYMAITKQAVPVLAIIAGVLNLFRMQGWNTLKTIGKPIVWVLHLGYGWLAIGLILRGVFEYADLRADAFHGIGVGAIGTITLALMSRAALGHSGRQLITPKPVIVSYLLVSVAAVARLSQPLLGDGALIIAAGAWSLAFALFTITYLPIVALPRIKPGQ